MFEKGGFPQLDPERLFVSFSTDTLFTRNFWGIMGMVLTVYKSRNGSLASVRIRLIRKPDRLVPRRSRVCGR